MGYRSEVAFVVPDSAPRFENREDNCFETVREEDGCRLYHTSWMKWYENDSDYPIVQAVMDYLSELDDEDFLFIRIGDDVGDIEEVGYFFDNPFNLGYTRRICFDNQ